MVTKGFEEIYITVHLCHAHGVKEPETPVTSKLMGRAVEEMRADRLAMEFNSQAAQALQALARLVLNPDCGLSARSGADRAYTKLVAMCQGAELLRQMY